MKLSLKIIRLPRVFRRYYTSGHSQPRQIAVRQLYDDPVTAIKSLQLERMPKPETSEREGVLIAVSHCAVHWVDCLMMTGQYQQAPPLPYTPGMEYSGTVVHTGDPQSDLRPGDPIYVGDIVNAGPRSYGSYQKFGGMASFAMAPRKAVRRMPENLSFAQAAHLRGGFDTCYHALVHCARVKAGEVALIHGATGAAGLAAVQLCSALGVDTFITGGSDHKLDVVETQCFGKGKVIGRHNYTSHGANLVRDVKNAVKSVDVVYDTVGGLELGRSSLKVLSFGGRYCVVGWTSTPFAGGGRGAGADHQTANVLPTNLIMMKGAQVIGCPVAIHTKMDPNIAKPRIEAMDRLVQEGLYKPYISHEFPLSLVQDALLAKWDRKVIGGCVVNCSL